MSAAVSMPVEPEPENDAPQEDAARVAAGRAALFAAAEKTKARWAAEIAAQQPIETPSSAQDEIVAERSAFVKRMEANLEEMRLRIEEHQKTCDAKFCFKCARHGCETCQAVAVPNNGDHCLDCQLRKVIKRASIPRRYADAYGATSQRVRSKEARKIAGGAINAAGVVLVGPAGCGKTTLGAAMLIARARWLIETGRYPDEAMFVSAIDIGLARAQHRLGAGEAELVLEAMTAGVLLLDDLGAEGARDADAIAAVLHERHNEDRMTWITTGLSPEDIGARYGGGIERRVFEGAVIIDCLGAKR